MLSLQRILFDRITSVMFTLEERVSAGMLSITLGGNVAEIGTTTTGKVPTCGKHVLSAKSYWIV